jgi:anaerobic magnesium-protoporphyrin IX monomethyl ester cyclase
MILISSSPKDALKIFQPFLPISAPIGAASLVVVAERDGLPVRFVDEQVEADPLRLICRLADELQPPRIFGFSVLTASYRQALTVAKQLKDRYSDSVTVFGGPHPTAVPDAVLAHPQVDLVVRGEGEAVFCELYRRLKNRDSLDGLAGVSRRVGDQIVHGPPPELVLDLDSLPRFPYDYFAREPYDLGFIMTSRGCPYRCIFCSNRVTTGKRYRFRNCEAVLEDLSLLSGRFGQRHINFLDDNFLVDKNRVYQLIEGIRRLGLDKQTAFSFQARGDNVDRELFQELRKANFTSVFFGLETASEDLMKVLQKGETVAQCRDSVRVVKELGFVVNATFIYALPGETHADRMNCARMSQELDLDLVRFNNATPYPGTRLFEMAKEEGRLNVQGEYENFCSVSTFIENPFRKIPLSYVPPGSTEAEIRYDILVSYLAFYLNWRRLKKIFSKPDTNAGWFVAGKGFWQFLKKVPALVVLALLMSVKFVELFFAVLRGKNTKLTFREMFGMLLRPGERPPKTRPTSADIKQISS